MRDRKDWHDIRSDHAKVLEALEAAIGAHPAGASRPPASGDQVAARRRARLSLVREAPVRESVVVPFRPRVVTLVPHRPGDGDDEPTAA